MNRFSSSREKFTELGYCLTSLEAAVAHVKQFSPDAFAAKEAAGEAE